MQTQIFPPKEVAMELKKVNFDWDCIGYYTTEQENDSVCPKINQGESYTNALFENYCTAPTYDQVIGWFAEVHNLKIMTVSDGFQYACGILENAQTLQSDYFSTNGSPDRQQSLLTAFREAIKLIQK